MKKFIILIALLFNLVPYYYNKEKGSLITPGDVMAQSYGDESGDDSEDSGDPCDENSVAYDLCKCDPSNCDSNDSGSGTDNSGTDNGTDNSSTYDSGADLDSDISYSILIDEVVITAPGQTYIATIDNVYTYISELDALNNSGSSPIGSISLSSTAPPTIVRVDCSKQGIKNSQDATSKYNQPAWNDALDVLDNDRSSPLEHAVTIEQNQCDNSYSGSSIVEGDETHVAITINNSFVDMSGDKPCISSCSIGSAHTHPPNCNACLSAGDLKTLGEFNKESEVYDKTLRGKKPGSGTFTDLYSIGANGEKYDFHVVDPAKLQAVLGKISVVNGGFDSNSDMGKEFQKDLDYFKSLGFTADEAFAYATAAVLTKFDCGVQLLQSENGVFKEIDATPVKDNAGKPTGKYLMTKCR